MFNYYNYTEVSFSPSRIHSLIHSFNLSLRVLSYYIILFPSLDVISVYPLAVLTAVNNLYTVIFGKDVTMAPKNWTTFFIILAMKGTAATVPILLAMAVSNLVIVLKYAGLMGYFIVVFGPTILQLASQYKCVKTFKYLLVEDTRLEERSVNGVTDGEENSQLIPTSSVKTTSLYMTPYSTVFSYLPVVVAICGVGVAMFFLTIGSLFVHPNKD